MKQEFNLMALVFSLVGLGLSEETVIIMLGIMGMISLVIFYVLMLSGELDGRSYKFLFGNLFGAVCLAINGFASGILIAYPILNVVWIMGTLVQIIRKWRKTW